MTAGVEPMSVAAPTWWRRPGLDVVDDRLTVNGADLEALVHEHGAPLLVYDLARPGENVRALQAALDRAGVRHVVRFALKACPEPPLLAVLRGLGAPGEPGSVGIDACSPGEVLHALANGWLPDEISHTGTNVSERDLDVLLAHPIRINLDAVSQVERLGRRAPGRTVGLRINPGAGAGYTEHLEYAGDRPTKFGITEDRFDDAIDAVRRHGLDRGHVALPRGVRLARRPAGRVRGGARPRRRAISTGCSRPASRSARSTSAAGSAGSPGTASGRWTSTRMRRSWRGTSGPTT